MVQPAAPSLESVLLLRPLGGSEAETIGIYKALHAQFSLVKSTEFEWPMAETLADFEESKLLYDANRLVFRQASGPIRCIGRLSFRPRSYQLVPLVMALRQLENPKPLRLMIADDVGVGKTIEALMILAELRERRHVTNIAVICPPHLCEQWQGEIKAKLGLDVVIVRSSTVSSLDRQLPPGIVDSSIWKHFPVTVVSIDYIKASGKIGSFLRDAPELVIVDEAHTAALPKGAQGHGQQQRYDLLKALSEKAGQHMVLLTATPHSGKDEEFKSLLGLLDPAFENIDLSKTEDRKKLAPHFVQRKRADLLQWLEETTRFPERIVRESPFTLANSLYHSFYTELFAYVKRLSIPNPALAKNRQRMRYWAALALMRGAMSSPGAGIEMLRKRLERMSPEVQANIAEEIDRSEMWFGQFTDSSDLEEADMVDTAGLHEDDADALERLLHMAEEIRDRKEDPKVKKLLQNVKQLLKEGFRPIVFCKYINTAEYVGAYLNDNLGGNTAIKVVTGELGDEQRRERIDQLRPAGENAAIQPCILVATDCLSEGINLQDIFTAVIHYDLPWNPNRLEQREGRIDRFGQQAPKVRIETLYGEDNQIDRTVMKIIVEKMVAIQKNLGSSIPMPEGKGSIIELLLNEIMKGHDPVQLSLFGNEVDTQMRLAAEKARNIRSVFSHSNLKPEDLQQDLEEVDAAIGTPETVKHLMQGGLKKLAFTMETIEGRTPEVFRLRAAEGNANASVQFEINRLMTQGKGKRTSVFVCFESPAPAGVIYLGRNHPLVEASCQTLLRLALEPEAGKTQGATLGRCAVLRSPAVKAVTTLVMARVRNVIKSSKHHHEIVAEEMYLWGYERHSEFIELGDAESQNLLLAENSADTNPLGAAARERRINEELDYLGTPSMKQKLEEIAERRCRILAESHQKFGKAVGEKFEPSIKPVIPPDVIGLYILIPVL